MSQNTYSYKTIVSYLLIFFSPLIAEPLNFNEGQRIYFTAFVYIIGAILLLSLNTKHSQPNAIEKRNAKTSKLLIVFWGILGIALAFMSQAIASYLEQTFLQIAPASENTATLIDLIKQYPIYIVAVSIAGPIMEELVFRRAIIGFLSQALPSLISAIISSLLFAFAHSDGHLLVYFSMAMTFYFLYQKTGSIWTPIIAHCAMNFVVVLIQTVI